MKIVLFGLGNFFKNRKHEIDTIEHLKVIAFSDNNPQLWGQYIDGIEVVCPNELLDLQFDMIMITSIYTIAIKKQLLNLGVDEKKIVFWIDYWSDLVSGKREIYYPEVKKSKGDKSVLIISTNLGYNGGTLAAIYAAQALQLRKMDVTLTVPEGNPKLIQECVCNGITIVVYPVIPYIKNKEIDWIQHFDVVLVNVLRMMPSACAISRFKPVVWWIHESVGNYLLLSDENNDIAIRDKLSKIQICTVSKIPQRLFNTYIENRVDAILHYGIPDKGKLHVNYKNKVVFAIIGGVCAVKGHDIFVEAIKKMELKKKENAEFWIIGKNDIDEFSKSIVEQTSADAVFKVFGEKTRKEIEELYSEIDVIVSASRIDSLPIVLTEGMMYGKICITTDTTGMADYIEDGRNGFIVKHENSDDLCKRMEWILDNWEQLDGIRKQARKTYEEYFTIEQFGVRLERMFKEAERKQRNRNYMM